MRISDWSSDVCSSDLVDKKVIYIDQFVFSELFKLKAGTRREDKLTPFWKEVDTLLHRVVHLQQAVLPHSNIHHAETVVSAWPRELREAYEAMGGDLRFEDTSDIRSEEHTSELQSLMRISYAVFCL